MLTLLTRGFFVVVVFCMVWGKRLCPEQTAAKDGILESKQN